MFDQIVNPRSLTKMSPAEKDRLRVRLVPGVLLYSLAVLLQIGHDHSSFLALHDVKFVMVSLMIVGLVLQFWALAAHYFDWGTTVRKH